MKFPSSQSICALQTNCQKGCRIDGLKSQMEMIMVQEDGKEMKGKRKGM